MIDTKYCSKTLGKRNSQVSDCESKYINFLKTIRLNAFLKHNCIPGRNMINMINMINFNNKLIEKD